MDDATLARFRKVCGLLGSDQVGERAAAALKATEILKASGGSWEAVLVNGKSSAADKGELAAAVANMNLWRTLLDDERTRTTTLSKQLMEAKRALEKLRRGDASEAAPVETLRKPSKKQRRKERVAEQATQAAGRDDDPEDELRRHVVAALADYEAGALEMSDRTLEFLQSVSQRARWTERQVEAIERTLKWLNVGRRVA